MCRSLLMSLLMVGAGNLAAGAAEYIPSASNRVFYFGFDGQSLANSVTNPLISATGTSLGAYQTGRMITGDYAANFDGNAIIEIGSAPGLAARTFTVSVWFKRAGLSGAGTIIERPVVDPAGVTREGWTFGMVSNDTVRIIFRGGATLTFKKPLLDDTLWHHAALSCSYSSSSGGTTVNAYLDGETLQPAGMFVPAGSCVANTYDNIIVGASDGPSATVDINPLAGTFWTGLVDNVALYNVALSADRIDTLYKDGWMPDPDVQASGTFTIPAIIHQVLYDPPGDMSYARTMSDTTYTSTISSTWSFGAGVSTTAGLEAGFHIATIGASVGFSVSAEVSGSVTGENSATLAMRRSSSWSTPATEDPAFNGPWDGDMIVCQQMSYTWRLWRQLKATATAPVGDDDYNYRVFYAPRSGQAADAVEFLTIPQFQARYASFGTVASQVINQLAIDPATRRVRQSLVGTALVNPQTITVSGGASEQTRSSTMSRSFTFSHQLDLSANASVEAKLCGMTGRAEATISFSTGGATGTSTTHTHSCGYLLSDNDARDRYRIVQYEDRRTGGFVFDVIKDSSYATFPYDDDYARRGIDWTVAGTGTPASVPAGQVQTHTIRVTNTTPSVAGLADSVPVRVELMSFAHTAELPTVQRWIRRGQFYDFPIELSAPVAGTFAGQFQFIMLNPSTQAVDPYSPRQTVNVTGTFTTPVRGVFIRAPATTHYVASSITGSVTHPFTATVVNTSGQSENLAVGVSNLSSGTAASPSAFSNPVAPGDSVSLVISFTCSPLTFPHSAVFWARVDTFSATRRQVTFRIDTAGSILITAPAAGAAITPDAQATIAWQSTGPALDSVQIHYSTDGAVWTPIAAPAPNTGSYVWTVPVSLAGATIRVRVADHARPTIRAGTVANVAVETMVAVRARRAGLRPDGVRLTVQGGAMCMQFGDPAVSRVRFFGAAGRYVGSAVVVDGVARVGRIEGTRAGQTLLAVWQTGRGTLRNRRFVLP